MRRQAATLVVCAALGGAGAACREDQSVVVVTTNIAAGVPAVNQLRVHLHLASGGDQDLLYPQQPAAAPIRSGSTLAVVLPTSRSGGLDLVVHGLAGGTAVARGTGQTTIQVGGRADATVLLELCQLPDCGTSGGTDGGGTDGGAPDGGPPDGGQTDGASDGTPQVTLATGLVARWKMDDGATNPLSDMVADSSGRGNNGSIQATAPTWVTDVFPGARYANPGALEFQGIYITVGTNGYAAFEQPKSIALWLKFRSSGVPVQEVLAINDDFERPNGSQLVFHLVDDAATGLTLSVLKKNDSPILTAPFPRTAWHHVAYTFDGALHHLYLDGQETAPSSPSDVLPDTGRVAFSQLGGLTFTQYEGTMDEARIYARTLSAAEVLRLAQGYE